MPNDTLDEIEARWRDAPLTAANWYAAVRILIEMMRARDRVVEAGEAVCDWHWNPATHAPSGEFSKRMRVLAEALAALDTPPAQEQKR